MMIVDDDTPRYALHFDGRLGIGFIRRKRDGAETPLIIGSEMADLRRTLNRAKTNATAKRTHHRPLVEIVEAILSEYFPPEGEAS